MDKSPRGGHVEQIFSVTYLSGTRDATGCVSTWMSKAPVLAHAPLTNAKVLVAMRATFARVALVLFISTSVVGCSSMSKLAFWRSKKDDTKLADAPKYSGTNSQL